MKKAKHLFIPLFKDVISSRLQYHRDSIEAQLKDRRGMTVVHYATWTKQSKISDVKPFLLDQNALLTDMDRYGRTVLHFAAQRGNIVLVEMLLTLKDFSAESTQDSLRRTPLHNATESKRVQVIDMLRDHGISVDIVDDCGRTALLYAAAEGTLEAFKHLLFLEGEQQLASMDNNGKDVFRLAYETDNVPVVKYLETTYGMSLDKPESFLGTDKKDVQLVFSWTTALLLGLCFAIGALLPRIFAVLLLCSGIRVTYQYL